MTMLIDYEPETAPAPAKHIPGEAGAWIFILGDMCVFAVLFCVYLVQRSHDTALFAQSQEHLNRNLGAINTIVLLVSSLCVVLAVGAVRTAGRQHFAPPLIIGALLCGACFIVVKAIEYYQKFADGRTPATNDFYMYYFVLTGVHLVHLIFGMGVLAVLWNFARRPELSKHHLFAFEGGACFWHMVDLLWIVLYPLLFLVR